MKTIAIFDIETSDSAGLLGYSVRSATEHYWVAYNGDPHQLLKECKQLSDKYLLGGHNVEYEVTWIYELTNWFMPFEYDTWIMSQAVYPLERHHSLKYLAVEKVGREPWGSAAELIKKYGDMKNVPAQELEQYCMNDTEANYFLLLHLLNQHIPPSVTIETRFVPIIVKLNHTPVTIDPIVLHHLRKEVVLHLDTLSDKIAMLNGAPLNLNQHGEVSRFLYEKCGVDPVKYRIPRGKSGQYSTKKEYLEEVDHPAAALISEARHCVSLLQTYIPAVDHPSVQSKWSASGSVTGRMASSGPNLQDVPVRTELGRKIRKAFVARPGYTLVVIDFSQQELRVAAVMSGCKLMLEMFRKGTDIHAVTAAYVFNKPDGVISPDEREVGKQGNFQQIYGGLAKGFTWEMYHAWFRKYPEIKKFQQAAVLESTTNGFVRTWWGKPIPTRYSTAKTIDTNYKVQGTGALITKTAAIRIDEIQFFQRLLLMVHDELVYEVPDKHLLEFVNAAAAKVETIPFPIKLEAKIGAGPNWLDAK